MSLTEFLAMSFEKKCDLITFNATFVFHRKANDLNVFLYHYDGLFIEVFHSPKKFDVVNIEAFVNSVQLEPYLNQISIHELISVK